VPDALLNGEKDNMLKELIEKYYQDKRTEKDKVKFYISDAGKCARQIFFKFKKAPRAEMEPRLLRIFEHGDIVHQKLVRTLESLSVIESVEIPIHPREDISGRVDAIVSIEGERYLVDFKSINSSILRGMEEPKQEHVFQIQLYLHFFNIKKGILLYEGKDTLELKEFPINYDENLAKQLLKEFEELKQNLLKNIIPDRLIDYPENWQCTYCQFREICDITGPDDIDWDKFKEKIKSEEKKD